MRKSDQTSTKMRYITHHASEDLKQKMVFIGGPRQVGKTTLALSLLTGGNKQHPAYFNWDIPTRRKAMRNGIFPENQKLIILDEIHKYPRWRNLVKGFYDHYEPAQKSFLVTGSARLDHYRKGGDSLQGRYHYYRLHPYSLNELNKNPSAQDLAALIKFGGFPEPYFSASERVWRRWQRERLQKVIYEDLRDLENVREISLIELLAEALEQRVGSTLSLKSLQEDLEVSHASVERWIRILENLYLCFRIAPFVAPKLRAVKKEQKLYFWDWSQVTQAGSRFENLVASQLLKYCHFQEDTEGYRMELRYFRDTDLREVDFVVIKDRKPIFAVECKTGEKQISTALKYLKARSQVQECYQVHLGQADYRDQKTGIRVLPFWKFCTETQMP